MNTREPGLPSPELVADLREFSEDVVLGDIEPEVERAVRRLLSEARELVGPRVRQRIVRQPFTAVGTALEEGRPYLVDRTNPCLPQVEVVFEGDTARAFWTPAPAYEGPTGLLHGGMSAHLVDVISGVVMQARGVRAVTARLDISYRRPIPLDATVELVSELTGSEGRKHHVAARLLVDGVECVISEGLFIALAR